MDCISKNNKTPKSLLSFLFVLLLKYPETSYRRSCFTQFSGLSGLAGAGDSFLYNNNEYTHFFPEHLCVRSFRGISVRIIDQLGSSLHFKQQWHSLKLYTTGKWGLRKIVTLIVFYPFRFIFIMYMKDSGCPERSGWCSVFHFIMPLTPYLPAAAIVCAHKSLKLPEYERWEDRLDFHVQLTASSVPACRRKCSVWRRALLFTYVPVARKKKNYFLNPEDQTERLLYRSLGGK